MDSEKRATRHPDTDTNERMFHLFSSSLGPVRHQASPLPNRAGEAKAGSLFLRHVDTPHHPNRLKTYPYTLPLSSAATYSVACDERDGFGVG